MTVSLAPSSSEPDLRLLSLLPSPTSPMSRSSSAGLLLAPYNSLSLSTNLNINGNFHPEYTAPPTSSSSPSSSAYHTPALSSSYHTPSLGPSSRGLSPTLLTLPAPSLPLPPSPRRSHTLPLSLLSQSNGHNRKRKSHPPLPRAHGKRWHALMELVDTERGYVRDLRVLVEVYLPALLALPPTTLPPHAYAAIARNLPEMRAAHVELLAEMEAALEAEGLSEHEHRNVHGNGYSKVYPSSSGHFGSNPNSEEGHQSVNFGHNSDYADSDEDEERDDDEVEDFDRELTLEEGQTNEEYHLTTCITHISHLFLQHISQFSMYEPYCASHARALAHLSRASTRAGTAEWRALERRCMAGAMALDDEGLVGERREVPFPSAGGRLMLRDQLIKPVQRVCRYPLLLAKLRVRGGEGEGDRVLEEAYDSMRGVAERVDAARERAEREGRGERIRERVEVGVGVTPELLASLGPPLLAGALDVLVLPAPSTPPSYISTPFSYSNSHSRSGSTPSNNTTPASYSYSSHSGPPSSTPSSPGSSPTPTPRLPPSSTIPGTTPVREAKVRYLGAFLYAGCLLLVKPRKQSVYAPRHCLELAGAALLLEGGELPHSICLVRQEAHFHLAASCAQERAIWLPALAAALVHPAPTPEGVDLGSRAITPLDEERLSIIPPAMQSSTAATTTTTSSSTSSVTVLRRPSASQRHAVDRALADVVSDACLAARAQATAARAPLFEAPEPAEDFAPRAARSHSFGSMARSIGMRPSLSLGARSAETLTALPGEARRPRLSLRSLTLEDANDSSSPSSGPLPLDAVPESPPSPSEGRLNPRRRRTYSTTMSSVREAFLSRRISSVQSIPGLPTPTPPPRGFPPNQIRSGWTTTVHHALHHQLTGSQSSSRSPSRPRSSGDLETLVPQSAGPGPPVVRRSSFFMSRQRTRSAPGLDELSPSRAAPPPRLDIAPADLHSLGDSGPSSPIEFKASGRYSQVHRTASPDTVISEPSSVSDESAIPPAAPPVSRKPPSYVHVRTASDDIGSTAGHPAIDFTRLSADDARKAGALTRADTMRKRVSTTFFTRLNPFTPVNPSS